MNHFPILNLVFQIQTGMIIAQTYLFFPSFFPLPFMDGGRERGDKEEGRVREGKKGGGEKD